MPSRGQFDESAAQLSGEMGLSAYLNQGSVVQPEGRSTFPRPAAGFPQQLPFPGHRLVCNGERCADSAGATDPPAKVALMSRFFSSYDREPGTLATTAACPQARHEGTHLPKDWALLLNSVLSPRQAPSVPEIALFVPEKPTLATKPKDWATARFRTVTKRCFRSFRCPNFEQGQRSSEVSLKQLLRTGRGTRRRTPACPNHPFALPTG
jgi:hypothetical protein